MSTSPQGARGDGGSRALRLAAFGATVALCGCVGPDFHRPSEPRVERYTIDPIPEATAAAPGPGGEAQRFLAEQDLPKKLVDTIRFG